MLSKSRSGKEHPKSVSIATPLGGTRDECGPETGQKRHPKSMSIATPKAACETSASGEGCRISCARDGSPQGGDGFGAVHKSPAWRARKKLFAIRHSRFLTVRGEQVWHRPAAALSDCDRPRRQADSGARLAGTPMFVVNPITAGHTGSLCCKLAVVWRLSMPDYPTSIALGRFWGRIGVCPYRGRGGPAQGTLKGRLDVSGRSPCLARAR
jgi:hypothetical protein